MSENQNTPQSFDLVLGGNNPPKKKIEKPKLKKKANLTNNKDEDLLKTEIQQSLNIDQQEKKNSNKSQIKDQTKSNESQSSSEASEEGCCEAGCGCLILLIIIGGIAQIFI